MGAARSLPRDNHRFSFAVTTPSVGVLPEKKKERKRDPILCVRFKGIEVIMDFHFNSLKNRFLPVERERMRVFPNK